MPAMTMMEAPEEALSRMIKKWDGLRASDDARQALVEEMLATLRLTQGKNDELQKEIDALKFHEGFFTSHIKTLEAEKKTLSQQTSTSPFALVLIDGDNTLFNDSFINAGLKGGAQAAQQLREALNEYLDDRLGPQKHRKLMVRIFVHLKGLTETYNKARIGSGPDSFRSFVLGFNRELPLAEFVDAGDDKEGADNKIKGNLELYWENIHCKHIVLAASADRGYVNFLRQYSTESAGADKLTLIEAVPFPQAFQELANQFKVTKFEKLFRSQKIEVLHATPPPLRTEINGAGTYATAATSVASPTVATTVASPVRRPAATATVPASPYVTREIDLNESNQRIDRALPQYDNKLVMPVHNRYLCHRFFLTRCDKEYCASSHRGKLSDDEERALMRVARQIPCANGPKCRDRDCVCGHHCPYDENCRFTSNCKYGPAMHNIIKYPVKTI